MSKSINVEITTKEQRDDLIRQLKEMSFDKEVKSWEDLGYISGWYVNSNSAIQSAKTQKTFDFEN